MSTTPTTSLTSSTPPNTFKQPSRGPQNSCGLPGTPRHVDASSPYVLADRKFFEKALRENPQYFEQLARNAAQSVREHEGPTSNATATGEDIKTPPRKLPITNFSQAIHRQKMLADEHETSTPSTPRSKGCETPISPRTPKQLPDTARPGDTQ